MTEPALRPRRGAHRAPRSRLSAFAPLIVLIAGLLVVIWVVSAVGGDEEAATTTAPASAVPTPSPTPAPPSPALSAAPPPSAAPPAPEQPARERFEVVVLNQTQRAGLAASVAETVRADGWVVASTGNFGGTVPATTVYFPSGGEAAATEIARLLPVDPRVLPIFPAVDSERITVIVTDNFP